MAEKNLFLIQWYGPFRSRQELSEWESSNGSRFNLYLFQGKLPRKRTVNYYCGMTYSQYSVSKRLGNRNHHIHDYEGRPEDLYIWIGCIANRSRLTRKDVLLCENMLISEMVQMEIGESEKVNATSICPPAENVYIINEWFNKDGVEHRPLSGIYAPNKVPDVISYYAPEQLVYSAKRLRSKGKLKNCMGMM